MFNWGKKTYAKTHHERDGERHEVAVRVNSRQLPGFRAITLDLSRTGLKLETQDLLDMGDILQLDLQFDNEQLDDFSVPAEVVWSKRDGERRSHFLAGLAFQPETDEQRRQLTRMATFLQVRSESDLETLLEEAKKLDPHRSATFTRQAARTTSAMQKHPGLFIPLRIALDGYSWDRAQQRLILLFSEGEEQYQLFFPQCQALTDHGCARDSLAVGLYITKDSERLRSLALEGSGWKHYRLVSQGHDPLLDILSQNCDWQP